MSVSERWCLGGHRAFGTPVVNQTTKPYQEIRTPGSEDAGTTGNVLNSMQICIERFEARVAVELSS